MGFILAVRLRLDRVFGTTASWFLTYLTNGGAGNALVLHQTGLGTDTALHGLVDHI